MPASSVRTNATRCRIPPESFDGRSASEPASPKRANSAAASVRASRRPTPWFSSARQALSSAVRQGRRQSRCGISTQRASRPPPSSLADADPDRARVRRVEPGDEREQRRLAGAAAADDPDAPVQRHGEIDAARGHGVPPSVRVDAGEQDALGRRHCCVRFDRGLHAHSLRRHDPDQVRRVRARKRSLSPSAGAPRLRRLYLPRFARSARAGALARVLSRCAFRSLGRRAGSAGSRGSEPGV